MVSAQHCVDFWLDDIYDTIDVMMSNNLFKEIDKILERIILHVRYLPVDILIGWLAITLPAKSNLDNRVHLVDAIRKECECTKQNANELLKGLE